MIGAIRESEATDTPSKQKKLERLVTFLYRTAVVATIITALATGSVLVANPIIWNCAVALLSLTTIYISELMFEKKRATEAAEIASFLAASISVVGVCCGLAQGYLAAGSVFGNLAIAFISLSVVEFLCNFCIGTANNYNDISPQFKKLPGIVCTALGVASLSHLLVVTQSASTATGVLLAITLALTTVSALLKTADVAKSLIDNLMGRRGNGRYTNLSANDNRPSPSDHSHKADRTEDIDSDGSNKTQKPPLSAQISENFQKSAVGHRLRRKPKTMQQSNVDDHSPTTILPVDDVLNGPFMYRRRGLTCISDSGNQMGSGIDNPQNQFPIPSRLDSVHGIFHCDQHSLEIQKRF